MLSAIKVCRDLGKNNKSKHKTYKIYGNGLGSFAIKKTQF